MSNLEFTILDNSDLVKKAKDEAIEAALEAMGQQAESWAKRNITESVPRRPDSWYTPTGNLRNSITHEVRANEETVYVGTDNPYAVYNEVGTGKYAEKGGSPPWWYKGSDGRWHHTEGMKPIHFLRDAVQDHLGEYKDIAERYLKGK